MTDEMALRDELRNIAQGQPLWPGDTLSHATANECVRRGWAKRTPSGDFVLTPCGAAEFARTPIQDSGR